MLAALSFLNHNFGARLPTPYVWISCHSCQAMVLIEEFKLDVENYYFGASGDK